MKVYIHNRKVGDTYEKAMSVYNNRGKLKFKDLTPSDKIITLSTCYDNKYKVVLHAKLIKREVIE